LACWGQVWNALPAEDELLERALGPSNLDRDPVMSHLDLKEERLSAVDSDLLSSHYKS